MGARFSAPVQIGPRAYPAACTVGTGSFPGVNRPRRGADHPPPSKCRGQERVGLNFYSPLGLRGLSFEHFYLYYVEMSGEHHIMPALPPGKDSLVPTEQKGWMSPKQVWTFLRSEKHLATVRNHPARGFVTVQTMLYKFSIGKGNLICIIQLHFTIVSSTVYLSKQITSQKMRLFSHKL